MEKFNFKVGDKICLENSNEVFVEILVLFGEEKNDKCFTGINDKGHISWGYIKLLDWQPHQEPKQKQKLQKLYCGTTDELIYPEYWETKEEALKNRKNVYTEAEFLEKFDVEI